MKIKKFNQYIKEDTSNVYDIERPFIGDADNLSTQDDESIKEEELSVSDDDAEMEIISALSNLDKSVLQAIVSGKINIKDIAQTLLIGDDMGDFEDEEGKEYIPPYEEGSEDDNY
jgi:hypothetical protein